MNYVLTALIAISSLLGGYIVHEQSTPNVGASQSISSLTELTSLSHNDVLPITEVNGLTTKKVKWGTATSSMKAVFDPLYSPIFSTSAGLAGLLSDETGTSGGFVRAGSPTITSPVISSLSSLSVGSDATGDIYYRNGSGNFVRLAMPSGSGYYLTGSSTLSVPQWDNNILANPYNAAMVFNATTTFNGPLTIDNITTTPNNAEDGVLNVPSGTVTLNDANHVYGDYAIYNYSTGNIAAGATLTTGANLLNKILVLRFTGTTTISGTIDLSGKGGPGGALNATGTPGASSFVYSAGNRGSSAISSPGSGGVSTDFSPYDVWCGSGGGGGISKSYAGGVGGAGGGGIILISTGQLSFGGTLNMNAVDGSPGGNEGTYNFLNGDGGSGGGGGGGGKGLFLASSFATNTAKYTVTYTHGSGGEGSKPTGASGGSPPAQAQASGAGGGASGITAGSAGANGGTNTAPTGGQGAGGIGADGGFYIGRIIPVLPR